MGNTRARTRQTVAPELGILLAQAEQGTPGDRLLLEDDVVPSFPQLPTTEEDEACVVFSWDNRRAGEPVQVLHTLAGRQRSGAL